MRIRCLGSRGQIPVCGAEFKKYGGDTTCIEIISEDNNIIIVDAGSGIRHIKKRDIYRNNINIIFTHFHLDHIIGLPFFEPFYNSSYEITLYNSLYKGESIFKILSTIIGEPYSPLDIKTLPSKINFVEIKSTPFRIGSIEITPIKINHPNGGNGFRFEEKGKVFIFLTDNELRCKNCGETIPFSSYVEFCKDAELLIHDAEFFLEEYENYSGWGHSTYLDAVELAIESSVKRLGLFHSNHNHTDIQIDIMVNNARRIISDRGKDIECLAIGSNFNTVLSTEK